MSSNLLLSLSVSSAWSSSETETNNSISNCIEQSQIINKVTIGPSMLAKAKIEKWEFVFVSSTALKLEKTNPLIGYSGRIML